MEHEKVLRISELTRISRERELTEAEQAERATLRQQYLSEFRQSVQQTLENTSIREPDGTVRPIRKRSDSTDGENGCRSQAKDD